MTSGHERKTERGRLTGAVGSKVIRDAGVARSAGTGCGEAVAAGAEAVATATIIASSTLTVLARGAVGPEVSRGTGVTEGSPPALLARTLASTRVPSRAVAVDAGRARLAAGAPITRGTGRTVGAAPPSAAGAGAIASNPVIAGAVPTVRAH